MKARTQVVVDAGGRLARLDCRPPLTVRQVHADDPGTCALCVVGTAAGPLAGDELRLDITLLPRARATLQATGASLAQGAGGHRSLDTHVTLGSGARLHATPAPVVVTRGSRVDITVTIDLADDAAIEWHELLVLGRTGEPPGGVTVRWDVVQAGRPLLRQFLDLADPVLAAWPGTIGAARVLATTFVHDPALDAATVVLEPRAVAARLGPHTSLETVLGADAAGVRANAGRLRSARTYSERLPAATVP